MESSGIPPFRDCARTRSQKNAGASHRWQSKESTALEPRSPRARPASLRPQSPPAKGASESPIKNERIAPVALTHPDRVIFPESKLTKKDVFDYYQRVAPVMVPALAGRPLTLQQWPKGIGGQSFFRQNVQGAPAWATTVEVEHERRKVRHLIVDRPE